MKPFLTIIIFLTFSSTAKSQLNKGTWLVGGSGTFYSYNETYNSPAANFTAKYTNIDISASAGYFVVDKLVIGLRPTFSSYKGAAVDGGNTDSYKLAAGPFVRYYFLQTDKPFNLLTDISYQFGLLQNLGALHSKGKNNTFSAMGGTEFFFNNTAGMEILLGYTQKVLSIKNSPDEFNNKKNGFQASIGFLLHLEKL